MQDNSYTSTSPLGYLVDSLIDLIIFAVIANPLISKSIAMFIKKNKVSALFFIMMFMGILFYLVSSPNNIFASTQDLPSNLKGYIEPRYFESITPLGSPIGGTGLSFITITAYFHDKSYFDEFGRWHDGLDIIPDANYYKYSDAYKKTKQIIIVATMAGKACSFVDTDGGLSITIDSPDMSDRTLYHHMSTNFIPFKTCRNVVNGEALGVMGETGNATGIHVHYGTFRKDYRGVWVAYDPFPTL